MTAQPIAVLMIEDDPLLAQTMRDVFAVAPGGPFQLEWADRLSTGIERLNARAFDAVLLDFSLPDSQGLDTLRQVQAHAPAAPIVVLTGIDDECLGLEAVQKGAQDYLLKGKADSDLLVRSLRYAIERKQAEAENLRLSDHIRLLLDSTVEGIYGVDLQGTCTFINQEGAKMLGFAPSELLGRNMHFLVHHTYPDGSPYPEAECPVYRAFQSGQEIRSADEILWRRNGTSFRAEYSSAPIREKGVVIGGVVAFKDVTERRWAEESLRQAERALLRSNEELRIAGQIQRGLFPRSNPNLAGFDIAGASWPANATGGDYSDYLVMPDGCLVLTVADVSGHGLGPALLAASTRAYLRAFASTQTDVAQILGHLNRVLVSDVGEQFVTLILARLDPAAGALAYASAGHPPGYVLDRSGKVKAILESTAIPLGIAADTEIPAGPVVGLEEGDLILLITDGVFEACAPDGSVFGIESALNVIQAHRTEPARDIVFALHHAVRAFSERTPQQDDITAVVVKIESLAGVGRGREPGR